MLSTIPETKNNADDAVSFGRRFKIVLLSNDPCKRSRVFAEICLPSCDAADCITMLWLTPQSLSFTHQTKLLNSIDLVSFLFETMDFLWKLELEDEVGNDYSFKMQMIPDNVRVQPAQPLDAWLPPVVGPFASVEVSWRAVHVGRVFATGPYMESYCALRDKISNFMELVRTTTTVDVQEHNEEDNEDEDFVSPDTSGDTSGKILFDDSMRKLHRDTQQQLEFVQGCAEEKLSQISEEPLPRTAVYVNHHYEPCPEKKISFQDHAQEHITFLKQGLGPMQQTISYMLESLERIERLVVDPAIEERRMQEICQCLALASINMRGIDASKYMQIGALTRTRSMAMQLRAAESKAPIAGVAAALYFSNVQEHNEEVNEDEDDYEQVSQDEEDPMGDSRMHEVD